MVYGFFRFLFAKVWYNISVCENAFWRFIMKEIKQRILTGERALYDTHDAHVIDSVFKDGESPLKESSDLVLDNCNFEWKYPLWYCENVVCNSCTWLDMARAGVWYTNHIKVSDALIEAPKNFRRCNDVELTNVTFPNAAETLWNCSDVTAENLTAKGDYFAMNCKNITLTNFTLDGNYSFDGCENVTIRHGKLLSKDAFWNCENVLVEDSYICGEYTAWNSKNVTFRNCVLESLQGLCYVKGLTLENCKLINTTLSFEYSTEINAEVTTKIDSVFNPASGSISAPEIAELIVEKELVNPDDTEIHCPEIDKKSDKPQWRENPA